MLTKYERNRIQKFYGQAAADIFEHYAKLKIDHATKNSAPERAVRNKNNRGQIYECEKHDTISG